MIWRAFLLVISVVVIPPVSHAASKGERVSLGNDFLLRELTFDGHVWRTTRFARADGGDALTVDSDEFHLLFLDNHEASLNDYEAAQDPVRISSNGEQRLTIVYHPRDGSSLPKMAPSEIVVTYFMRTEPCMRKIVTLHMKQGDAIDRFEVERFSTDAPEERGGRGEPVFVNHAWFFGIEYPAAYSRHTDGNTPKAASGPYDKFGNYSFINLDDRDIDAHPRRGLIRLMHFPGNAKPIDETQWGIVSKTAVVGIAAKGETVELGFMDYLNTIRRPVRSFLHYNNYFGTDGKKLTAENFAGKAFAEFKKHLDPYGVKIDAMVADDGWQNKQSIYEPNPQQFPGGFADVTKLSSALESSGTHLGLWMALNGYNSDIDWGKAHGYTEAVENQRFKRFHRVYALSNPKYEATMTDRLTQLITQCHLSYIKHDFNQMCDMGDANGHLPTDRHGHEAEVDAELRLLSLERKLNPDIYQNITNWIWFSPFWLQNGNNLWMLSSDSGEFAALPEISLLIRATAYRDVNLHQVWHDPATRPLVPISHLMTHGIIYTRSKYSNGGDTLRDFSDYVMMYYMRGLQLKEWYIDPTILSGDQWEVLARHTRWSQEHVQTLSNSVFVGGDPAKGNPYGYMCWNGDDGILSVRNPSPDEREIFVPFDQTTWYRGANGKTFHAKVVYPWQGELEETFHAGQPIRLKVPGFMLMVMQLEPGAGAGPSMSLSAASVKRVALNSSEVTIPDEPMQRCDLMLIAHSPTGAGKSGPLPEVKIDGASVPPTRKAAGPAWGMISVDLRESRGKTLKIEASGSTVEGWLVMDRPVDAAKADSDPRLPMPVAQGFMRQTMPAIGDAVTPPSQ